MNIAAPIILFFAAFSIALVMDQRQRRHKRRIEKHYQEFKNKAKKP